jgi:hypothetical protein
VASLSDLNLGLFVGREDVLIAAERLAVPDAMVEIQDAGGLRCEVRISRKDPAPSGPRAEGILTEPSPAGHAADLDDQSKRENVAPQLRSAEAGKREAEASGKLTRDGLHRRDHPRGKTGGSSSARSIIEAGESLFVETFSPLAHDLPREIEALSDDLVLKALRSQKDELGADDLTVRQRILAAACLQDRPLARRQRDRVRAVACHVLAPG